MMDERDDDRPRTPSVWRRLVAAPRRRVEAFHEQSPEVATVAKIAAGLVIFCALLLALDAIVG